MNGNALFLLFVAVAALSLPADRVFEGAADSPDIVVFRHTTHVAYAENDCLACHPEPFSILGRHAPLRHEEMDRGRTCGACHDGALAFATDDVETCDSCHGADPGGRLPPDVRVTDGADGPGAVIFRHSTHGQQGCATCHPRPFAMQAGRTPLSKEEMYDGATCGACHDGSSAFAVDDAERCESCHVDEEVRP